MSAEKIEKLRSAIAAATQLLKLEDLEQKMSQLSEEMNRSDFWNHRETAQAVTEDYQDIKSEVEKWRRLQQKAAALADLQSSADASLQGEIDAETEQLQTAFTQYELFLLLNGAHDQNNAIVSLHAGSGGTEAQDWTAMLLRMLLRFCENQGWKTRIVDESAGAEAGYKSVTFEVKGRYAFGYLKSEHGVHRLVRISPFDAEKMRHTSFALVEVLPELPAEAAITLDPKDLRIDTFMSGGKGGQSVNTTYSAVRIVHIPTGISVSCQNERSQAQNKETALKILQGKLHRLEQERLAKERQELRGEYKSAEWGNQIRSYVLHPYHLVKDHRSDYESTDPESVLEGDLLALSEAYLKWIKA